MSRTVIRPATPADWDTLLPLLRGMGAKQTNGHGSGSRCLRAATTTIFLLPTQMRSLSATAGSRTTGRTCAVATVQPACMISLWHLTTGDAVLGPSCSTR